METLIYHNLHIIDTGGYIIEYRCVDTNRKILITTNKIRHRLSEIVSEEFLNYLYYELPAFYENHRAKRQNEQISPILGND